jgi:hypothetical protein
MSIIGFFAVALLAQQPRVGSIEGIVVQAGTPQPVARAVVELTGSREAEPVAVTTDTDGKFQFRNVAAGPYSLTVSRDGYLERRSGNSTLTVQAGQTAKDIRLTLIATGAISGRVYDSVGEPLANVSIRALKYSYADGQKTLTPVKTGESDDRGEYRLFWLPPGLYYINATPPGAKPGDAFVFSLESGADRIDSHGIVRHDRSPVEKLGEADVPVYYPGTTETQSAVPLEVRSGADIGGVDFTLARAKTRKVRGVAIDSVTGQPAANATVVLVPRTPSVSGSLTSGRPSSDGTFEIQGVLPGSYFLVATERNLGGGRNGVSLTGGRTPIEVGGSDLERLTVVLAPVIEIAGELVLEGLRDGQDDHHPIVTLKNEFPAPGAFAQMYASFRADQQFTIDNVVEGDYQVRLSDLPGGAYVKSIRFGAADALNGSLHIDPRATDRLEIVVSMNAGVLDGAVVNKNREPVANATVALVPDTAHRQRLDLYKSVSTDDSGRFHLQGIAPSDYFLFAWEDIGDDQWRDPEFIRRNEAGGKPIHILEGSRENIEVTVIPFP